jgi:hypothetical protein
MIAKFLNFSFSLWPCPLLPTLNLHFNSNEKPMKLFCKVKVINEPKTSTQSTKNSELTNLFCHPKAYQQEINLYGRQVI